MALAFLTLGITQTDLARRLKAGLSPAAAHLQATAAAAEVWDSKDGCVDERLHPG